MHLHADNMLGYFRQNLRRGFARAVFALLAMWVTTLYPSGQALAASDVGKWKRFEVAYTNPSFSGNPFDLEFDATFTHVATGRTLKQLGFYAGNNTWKIFFMPDTEGEWTFTTRSPDTDLNGKVGTLNCVSSNLPGPLVPAGNRWKLKDTGQFDMPVMLPSRKWLKSTNTTGGIQQFIDWADTTVGARLIGTTLVYFSHPQNAVPYIKGKEGDEFNIAMWDRLNSHYDAMRDAGMGFYIMFYSDDTESPNTQGITARSAKELRLLRYAAARFSAYPIVVWDSGIDIGETRSNSWIDWFADWFLQNDPWQHPVSSRSGGGSFGKQPVNATYWADGAATLPAHSSFVSTWASRSVPTIFTDRWREDYGRGGFDRKKIRRSVWEIGLVGGSGVYLSGNNSSGYLNASYASDFKAAPDVGHATRFFREEVQDFGNLAPHDELLTAGNAVVAARPGMEYVAYLPAGGSIELDLRGVAASFTARWYNPLSGTFSVIGNVDGGALRSFNAPATGDWVLHLVQSGATTAQPPQTSTGLGMQIIRP